METATQVPEHKPYVWAVFVLGFLLFAAAFSLYQLQPPAPLPAAAPAAEFSARRAIQHDYVIATEAHPAGSIQNDRVQTYILDTMKSFGVNTEAIASFDAGGHYAGVRNMVLGRIPGTAHTKAFALMAHYDSTPYGPGAADDCSGVISLLEIARAIKASPPLKNDIVFIFTDAEEGGPTGAGLFTEHPWFNEVAITTNLEARGTQGTSLMFATSAQNGWLIDNLIEAVRYPAATSLMYDVYKRMPFATDYDTLRRHGMLGYDIAFIDNFAWYHTQNDTPDHLSLRTLQQHGMYGLDLARHLGNVPLDGVLTAPDAIYFNTLGFHMVHYPLSWCGPLAAFAVLLFLAALIVGRIRKHLSITGVLVGVAAWGITAVMAASVATAMLALIWGPATAKGFFTKSFTQLPDLVPIYHNDLYTTAYAVASIAAAGLVFGGLCRWIRAQSLMMGAQVWWVALLIALVRDLPGGTFVAMWPLTFSTLGLLLCFLFAKPGRLSPAWIALLTLFSLPGVVLLTPAYHSFASSLLVMAAPGLAVSILFLMGLLIPQLDLFSRVNRWWFPLLGACGAAILLAAGLARSNFTPERPKLDSVSYAINYDINQAYWLSADAAPDEWTSQFFPKGTARELYKEFVPHSRELVMKAPAPIAPEYPGPQIMVQSDTTADNIRELTLHIASPAHASRVNLRMAAKTPVIAASVNGKPLDGSDRHWRLRIDLFPKEGVDLTLRVPVGAPIKINTCETLYRLPILPGYRPRPGHIIALPNTIDHRGRDLKSNHIYVMRTFTL